LRPGDTLVVQGAGGLGLNAVAVARDLGADRVIVLDRVASRLELARAFGADHALNVADLATPERRIQAVMDLTGGFGADVAADFVGYPEVVPEGLRMLRGGGCYLEIGSIAPGNIFSYDATALVRGNTRLVAASNYSPWALARALAFLRRNVARFPFERLISHVFALARISEAFQAADWMQRGGDGLRLSRAALSMAD
jgi:threonine dehydrogenase-like Zn-dependent dehydrogenase